MVNLEDLWTRPQCPAEVLGSRIVNYFAWTHAVRVLDASL